MSRGISRSVDWLCDVIEESLATVALVCVVHTLETNHSGPYTTLTEETVVSLEVGVDVFFLGGGS